MSIKAVRGFKDILPEESAKWHLVEEVAREVFRNFGFSEIRTPVLEKTELFARGIGEQTDIVEKEMYTFEDRNGERLTLRPEATAGVVRAYIEHKLHGKGGVIKLFTMGPMFRHERPQKGRLRQFHQIDVEVLGSHAPMADAEVIWSAWQILEDLGVEGLRLELNSLGCPNCRPAHREDLLTYLDNVKDELCDDCNRRRERNPLRVFDCKNEQCRTALKLAPLMKHYMCPDCAQHMGQVMDLLEGASIPFVWNPYLVRGLDYYTRTTFEIVAQGLGAQSTVAAGGRYDGLVKELGGPDVPGVGMAIGVERLLLLLGEPVEQEPTDLFVAALGRDAREEAIPWLKELRSMGFIVQMSYEDKGLKAQLRQADRMRARYCLIVGEDELDEGVAKLRCMVDGSQEEIDLDGVAAAVAARLQEEGRDE